MSTAFSIRVYKQYFNFASSHFMLFKDGTREPLHGHNYRVQVKGNALKLEDDMVFDFLNIKPIVRTLCNELDHKLLLPRDNPGLIIADDKKNYLLISHDQSHFSIPKSDCLILPIYNTSAERLASYLALKIKEKIWEEYQFEFSELEIEVEETPGQSAIFILTKKPKEQ